MYAHLLPQLHYFWLAAKEGNFTRAAKRVFVSQSAISHQIHLLEEKLNTQLFDRSKRGVHMTLEGEHLFKTCEMIFQEIERKTSNLLATELGTPLKITAPTQLGNTIILDVIKRVIKKHPGVKINLHTTSDIAHFSSWQSDITLNYFPLMASGFYNLPTICSKYLAAASPGYLQKNGPIEKPADIFKHPILTIDPLLPDWKPFLKAHGLEKKMKDLNIIPVGNILAAMSLAAEDMGLVFTADFILEEALNKGILASIPLKTKPIYHWIFMIFKKQTNISPKFTIFFESLKEIIYKFKSDAFPNPGEITLLIDKVIKGEDIDTSSILKSHPPLSIMESGDYKS